MKQPKGNKRTRAAKKASRRQTGYKTSRLAEQMLLQTALKDEALLEIEYLKDRMSTHWPMWVSACLFTFCMGMIV